ncbi:MAG: riboflavin synthase [Pseudomonadota bacterium]
MFTGLIEEMGVIAAVSHEGDSYKMTIRARNVLDGVRLGDSIAVNGVCLTVTAFDAASFDVGLAPETRAKSNLGDLRPGAPVNLERSLTPASRMGGHFVQGHIDGTGVIESFRKDEDALWMTIKTPAALMPYIAPKGFIAIDGTSLTVVDVGDDWFTVTLIAYSQQKIIQPKKKPGDRVNLEVDILAKYLERIVAHRGADANAAGAITPQFLAERGFTKEGASA